MIIMKHPSSLFRRTPLTITNISVIIRRNAFLRRTAKHADDTKTDRGDGEGGAPAIIQDIKADVAVGVDMRMARGGREEDNLGSLHGVIGREDETKSVLLILVHAAGGARDCDDPLVHTFRLAHGHARHWGVFDRPFGQFARQTALCDARKFPPT